MAAAPGAIASRHLAHLFRVKHVTKLTGAPFWKLQQRSAISGGADPVDAIDRVIKTLAALQLEIVVRPIGRS
jgi:hypothetical protein